jgi:molybdate transport system regulatory protein
MRHLSIVVALNESRHALGPGMIDLLQGIRRHGSIRKAGSEMAMSYRKCWLLLKNMEQTFGKPMVATSTGGKTGGGATLTPLGAEVLKRYCNIEKLAARAAASDLKKLKTLSRQP